MPGREPRRKWRLSTVIVAIAVAGVVTGLNAPSVMAAQTTAPTSPATTPARDSALLGSQARTGRS
jgi:hypothetical protein